MFYLPFKFRPQKEYCTPKGPSFKWALPIKFSVNGNEINLRAPRNRAAGPYGTRNPHGARREYNLDGLHLKNITSADNTWGSLPIVFKAWDFYGPWFTGVCARLEFRVTIISPRDIKEGSSYFHPRTFESVIADYLSRRYKGNVSDGRQRWYAPVNWQSIESLPCVAASFEMTPNREVNGDDTKYFAFFPITEHHLLMFFFDMQRNNVFINSEKQKDTDKWINKAPMEDLVKDIINSIELKLSPETEALQRKAIDGLDDASLTKTFLPLKWTGNTEGVKLL